MYVANISRNVNISDGNILGLKCDAPNPGGPVDHRQPTKTVSYHETHT